jgi:TPR repeat protein
MANSLKSAQFLLESRIVDAMRGDTGACYDLGVFYSTATGGADYDLIEAHKWFNLAAVAGHRAAQDARGEIADDMTAREIATAQGAARAFLRSTQRRAA